MGILAKKVQHDAFVGFKANIEATYLATVAVGDWVKMSADYEVEALAAATDVRVGQVFAINLGADNLAQTVTVEARSAKISVAQSDAAITAGAYVVRTGIDTIREFVYLTDDASLIAGIALVAAAGAAESVDIIDL